MMLPFRKFLVIVLPVVVLFAWAGCITVCAEDTAGHENASISAEVVGECGAEMTADCQETCMISVTLALLERPNTTSPATECGPVRVSRFSIPDLSANINAACNHRILSPGTASPLNARPGNLRI